MLFLGPRTRSAPITRRSMLCHERKRVPAFGGVFEDPLEGLRGTASMLTTDNKPATFQRPPGLAHDRAIELGALLGLPKRLCLHDTLESI